MKNISISVADGNVHLDCSGFELSDDVIVDNVTLVAGLLAQLLSADHVKALLTEKTLQQRLVGIAAQDMVVQASILHALSQAQILQDVTAGHSSIADYGFPEFQSDRMIDV